MAAAARWLTDAEGAEEEGTDVLRKVLNVGILVVLAAFSAIFSGLNLGLMCLDANQLELLVKAGEKEGADREARQQAVWARRILPLRRDSNTLLCTVLLGNVMVNSYMAILMDEIWKGTFAVVVTTIVIVTFGEIIPQSLCYKHGLRIGSALVPLLRLFWIALFVISKPIALILDRTFGEEIGQVLDKEQLLTLIDYQRKQAPHLLTEQEANILHGSMDFSAKTAQSIMVPLGDCFCLDAGAIINQGLCAAVAAAGYSRIPVLDRDPKSPKRQFAVVGLVHVKDLLLVDADQDMPLKAILPLIGRDVFAVDDDCLLPDLLDEFRKGRSQLAVVRTIRTEEDCDPYYRHIGILTLQDLLNTIIQDDVHEVDADEQASQVSSVPSNMFSNVPRFTEAPARTQSFAQRWLPVRPVRALSRDEDLAAAAFLQQRHAPLFAGVPGEALEAFLLRECRLCSGAPPEAAGRGGGREVYLRGRACGYAALVVTGEVKVFAGREGFESLRGPWSLLARRCLELRRQAVLGGGSCTAEGHAGGSQSQGGQAAPPSPEAAAGKAFVPDFSAYAADEREGPGDGTRLLIINAEAYSRLLFLTCTEYGIRKLSI